MTVGLRQRRRDDGGEDGIGLAAQLPPVMQQERIPRQAQQQQQRPSSSFWRFSYIYCIVSFCLAVVAVISAPMTPTTNTTATNNKGNTAQQQQQQHEKHQQHPAPSFRYIFGTFKDAAGGRSGGGGSESTTTFVSLDIDPSTPATAGSTSTPHFPAAWMKTTFSPIFHLLLDAPMITGNDASKATTTVQQSKQQKQQHHRGNAAQHQHVPAWIRWALPPPKNNQQIVVSKQEEKEDGSSFLYHWFEVNLKPWLDPNIILEYPNIPWTKVIDKILTSTPRLLLLTNWLLSVTYLIHSAIATMFLGTTTTSTANTNDTATTSPNKGGFLLFKLLLISAVIGPPDTLDWIILLCWYTLVSFLKSLTSLARQTLERQTTATLPSQRRGVLQLLCWVLFWDILSASACVGLFYQAGWDMVLLLTSDSILLGLETCTSIVHYIHQSINMKQEQHVQAVEEEILMIHQRAREEAVQNSAAAAMNREARRWEQAAAGGMTVNNDDDDGTDDENIHRNRTENRHGQDDDDSSHGDNSVTGGAEGSPLLLSFATLHHTTAPTTTPYIPDPLLTLELEQQLETMELVHHKRVGVLESVVFWLELFFQGITIFHFIHVWKLHSLQFTLIDGVLLIHLHSAVSTALSKIARRRNYLRIARDLDGMFEDASEVDMKKAGDLCCICLGSMTTKSSGSVKKVGCGHVFHTHCLREVIERARSMETAQCPLCRARIVDGSSLNSSSTSSGRNGGGATQNNEGGGTGAGTNNTNNNNNTPRGMDVGGIATNNNNNDNGNNNNEDTNNNNGAAAVEHSLFRFSTEGLLPFLPAFSFEVVRRPAVGGFAEQQQQENAPANATENGPNNNNNNNNNNREQQQQNRHPSILQQVLWSLAGMTSSTQNTAQSPEAEAHVLEGLVDMFPQYDRSDLLRELRRQRGSGEAVVESILVLGTFRGEARGRTPTMTPTRTTATGAGAAYNNNNNNPTIPRPNYNNNNNVDPTNDQ